MTVIDTRKFILAALLYFPTCCFADDYTSGVYSDWSWDQATGSVHVYAQTTTDYSSAYYYSACAATLVESYPDSESPTAISGPYNCSDGTGGPIDAESTLDTTVTTAPTEVIATSFHHVTATYQVQTFESACTYDCDLYYDAFEWSLLGNGDGELLPDSTQWFAPGPPPAHVQDAQVIDVQIQRTRSTTCWFPTGERSIYNGILPSGDYWAGNFQAQLQQAQLQSDLSHYPPASFFDGRVVAEQFVDNTFSDGCYFSGSSVPQLQPPVANGAWPIKDFLYGDDSIGIKPALGSGIQNQIAVGNAPYQSCSWTITQSMYIDGCGGTSRTYDTGHTIGMTFKSTSIFSNRATATGPAK